MIDYNRIYKDIENNIFFGSGYIYRLTYADILPFSYYQITTSEETIDFTYEANGCEVIKTSVPYEMFWEPNEAKEIVQTIMETIIKIGRKASEQ